MQKIFKTIKVSCLAVIFMIGACDSTELDITQDPNALPPDAASTDFFISQVQVDFGTLIASLEVEASEAVRILNMDGRNYNNAFEPTRFDQEWEQAYRQILNDIKTMNPLAEEAEQYYHIAMGQVLEAYVLVTLVDLFGDVPYSQALLGGENLNPDVDPGANVYAEAEQLLRDAITNFEREDVLTEPLQDLFYQGDWENWIKAANSILLKVYLTTRLIDTDADDKFQAIIDGGDYITSTDEDFQFPWNTSFNNPDARHPEYVDAYTPGGTNTYMSNWLMDYMLNSKVGNGVDDFEAADPRMKYYFYRQTSSVPQDQPNLINCVEESAPPHYTAGTVFCSLANGYWGRDHGDDDGIPPDGQLRTAYGVYPVGGLFDDNSFSVIASITQGAGGGGITPIMLASWVDIMRAEMALVSGDAPAARNLLQSGVAKSFAKVRSFGELDATADLSTAPDPSLDATYITELGQIFDAATSEGERMDILGSEYFVALFGNGLDGFNFYRRTGRPSTLQPNLEPAPGSFFRSFFYPPVFVERNSSESQKADVTTPVFWDTGTPLLAN